MYTLGHCTNCISVFMGFWQHSQFTLLINNLQKLYWFSKAIVYAIQDASTILSSHLTISLQFSQLPHESLNLRADGLHDGLLLRREGLGNPPRITQDGYYCLQTLLVYLGVCAYQIRQHVFMSVRISTLRSRKYCCTNSLTKELAYSGNSTRCKNTVHTHDKVHVQRVHI